MQTNNINLQPLKVFAEKAYLDYAMYVILDRALPRIEDGLKPVQRRIIYAMSELGLKNSAKFKKSARTVGDVLGKYHPHGDSACYEAMVLMAQGFSYRYPLVDGQGNWGSMDDPKSFAAMRYTESRLSPYAQVLLEEVEQGVVDWVPNFDGTLSEPKLLPARLPNVLLNGAAGIAVGMATDIPPHNLQEVANACIHLLDHPQATLEEMVQYIPAPDFPTAAEIITPAEEILAAYRTGNGMLRMRATYTVEERAVVIVALPYQVSGTKVQEQIAAQMQAKKLPMLADLRDESDHRNPTRIVLVLKSSRVEIEALMAHLFATTDLESSYKINLNMVGINGKPQVKSLLQILQEWLTYRTAVVRRRLEYRLDKVLGRLEILAGLLVVYLNLEEVIKLIREEDHPKPALMERFQLSSLQVEAILELKLKQLAKLEEVAILREQKQLLKEQAALERLLANENHIRALIKREIQADRERFGDARRSQLVQRSSALAFSEEALLPSEPILIILSKQNWVRVAKGHEVNPTALAYKAGDEFKQAVFGLSTQLAVFLDTTGRSYSLPAHTLPSARGYGESLTSKLTLPPAANIVGMVLGEPEQLVLLSSTEGYGFLTPLQELYAKNRNGKVKILLSPHELPLLPQLVTDSERQYLLAITAQGRMLMFPVSELPMLEKGKGNKIIQLAPKLVNGRSDALKELLILNAQTRLMIRTKKRQQVILESEDLKEYQGKRGGKGAWLPLDLREMAVCQLVD